MTEGRPLPLPDDHDMRLAAARRVAEYELGDDSWADMIVGAAVRYWQRHGTDAERRWAALSPYLPNPDREDHTT
jgi:hypothetical protein